MHPLTLQTSVTPTSFVRGETKEGVEPLYLQLFFPPFSPPTNYNIVTQNSSSSPNWQLGNEGMVAEGFWSRVRAESPRRQISSFHGHLHRFLYIIPQNTPSCPCPVILIAIPILKQPLLCFFFTICLNKFCLF